MEWSTSLKGTSTAWGILPGDPRGRVLTPKKFSQNVRRICPAMAP
jgi:hypothetical protein